MLSGEKVVLEVDVVELVEGLEIVEMVVGLLIVEVLEGVAEVEKKVDPVLGVLEVPLVVGS